MYKFKASVHHNSIADNEPAFFFLFLYLKILLN